MEDATPAHSFRDLTLAEFVERLASAAPVPGGGSASAIAGSLAGALVAMVASLSRGKPRYEAHAALHGHAERRGHELADRLLAIAERDADAFAAYAAARKLPRETRDEQAARASAMREAARWAAEVPVTCVEACLDLVTLAESLAGRSNVNAASDLAVAANLAEAAARGATANVMINLPAMDDEAAAGDLMARVKDLLDEVERLAALAREAALSGEDRDPLPASPD